MPKMIIAALLSAFLLFSNCNKTANPTKEAAVSDTNIVTVWLSGLMVFHKEKGKPGYEVGILSPVVAPEHVFSVNNIDRSKLPNGPSWTLEITNSLPGTDIPPVAIGHSGRRPDSQAGQWDFDWLIDLEGPEFHNTKLNLKKGLLKPIIHLPNGHLSTQFKSLDLKRWQGSANASDFGFVPETIALQVELHPGQELVLRDDTPGPGAEILRLSYNSSKPSYLVDIRNIRHPLKETSDFSYYYALFGDTLDHYDFKANEDPGKLDPFNPFPDYTKTCCMMLCTSVLLGKRTDSLW
jgi:hypothetical protein